jgi:hypothetical protein
LQHASTSHVIENRLRALIAYDEALRVRTRTNAPLEYANTIANKASCLRSLPDDPARPELGQRGNLLQAISLYFAASHLALRLGADDLSAIWRIRERAADHGHLAELQLELME